MSEEKPPPPKGRGRARGRIKEHSGPDKPGRSEQEHPGRAQLVQQPAVLTQEAGPSQVASSRAAHRGASQTGQRQSEEGVAGRGGGGKPPVEGMERMHIGQGSEGGAVGGEPEVPTFPRPRFSRYVDGTFRPEGRSKKGNSGDPLMLVGNFFKVKFPETWGMYQYHVDFQPPCESRKLKWALLKNHEELIGKVKAFDGTCLYIPHRLPNDETTVTSLRIWDDQQVRVTIKFACELRDFSGSTLHVMNIIWRRVLAMMGMTQISRHYFDEKKSVELIKHGLKVTPGFQTSILQYESDVLLEIDITHKIMRRETVVDQMYRIHGYMNQPRLDSEAFRKAVGKEIIGTIVMTRYNKKTYTVDDIDWDVKVTHTFQKSNGSRISYVDYYKEQYQATITDYAQPMLVTRAKRRDIRRLESQGITDRNIHLVPELCVTTGLTDDNLANYNLMSDLATHTRINPEGRVKRLLTFRDALKENENAVQELRDWGMEVEDKLELIEARQLKPEKIHMRIDPKSDKEVEFEYDQQEADWSRQMRGKLMLCPVAMEHWVIIYQRKAADKARDLSSMLQRVGPPMGMYIHEPERVVLENDRNDTYIQAIKARVVQQRFKMVVCLLPNNKKDRYDTIKKYLCIQWPVPSQMVTEKTLQKSQRLMSVATKIAIQMNCKLGGVIWKTPIPLRNVMIVGIDTYHDSSARGKSIGAVVATINSDHTRYYSTQTPQIARQELHNHLRLSITACLRSYEEENPGETPEKLIVYRDGVGDGQLQLVYDHEVPQIRAAIGDRKLTFIVVKKRGNARFFQRGSTQSARGRGGGGGGRGGGGGGGPMSGFVNPGPGTVIDDVATKVTWMDFFLISQSVRQGTVGPTHYNLIVDDMLIKPEYYQRITYKLTHMYYNWQGTIRVPAPCMYAHKLAFLVGQSLHSDPHAKLATNLFYL